MRLVTLCFPIIRQPDQTTVQVLLGRKRRGFGLGKIVGFGGGLEAGETAAEAAVRELFEESGLVATVADLRHLGQVEFLFAAKPAWNMQAQLFTTEHWQGQPQNSDEMRPLWCSSHQLPRDQMWPDVDHWLPQVLSGQRVALSVTYGFDNASLLEVTHH
jgi:8-oxo-dGTP diphosphatase